MVDQNRQIWYNISMKVIKLDRRYHGFPKWTYACQFPLKSSNGNQDFRREYYKYQNAFHDMYGPDNWINRDRKPLDHSTPMWLYNENWYADFIRQRIYFKNQADITLIMLKISG
jgi:hypothetical protein